MNSCNNSWPEALYEKKAAALILYGRALGLSHSEAEDVLQETFVALLQQKIQPDEPEHYCLRAFRNRALNYRRGLWRRLTRELEAAGWFERASVDAETESQAVAALGQLPPDQREVIVLKLWHKMTFEEIAQTLELSPNTVAGRYRYGLNKLRFLLKGHSYERDQSVRETVAIMDTTSPVA